MFCQESSLALQIQTHCQNLKHALSTMALMSVWSWMCPPQSIALLGGVVENGPHIKSSAISTKI